MAALPPMLPRENNVAGSHMAVRNGSSTRLARWQPYFVNCNTIPNKRALPSLVRLQSSTSPTRSVSASNVPQQPTLSPLHHIRPEQPRDVVAEPSPAKPCQTSSQLLTPSSSPPGMPPTLLEQTSSNYVLELSLAILASIYFQPGCQQVTPNIPSPKSEDAAAREASPSPRVSSTPIPEPVDWPPITPTSVPSASTPHRPSKDVTPLTPQSPQAPPKRGSLPPPPPIPQQPAIRVQSLPSKRELTRHLNSLGTLEPQTGVAPTGSMRWFLTELFKRAALPGLIIRVAAGYVLRCRAAINDALQSVALKMQAQLASNLKSNAGVPLPPVDRTPQERVLTDARRVFLAALVLACKFVFDKPYDNRSWSLISGLGSRDIGECERVIGDVLGWRLWIGAGRSPAPSQEQ